MRILAIIVPQVYADAVNDTVRWNGCVARLVPPGHPFDGTEGWYQPLDWLEGKEALKALRRAADPDDPRQSLAGLRARVDELLAVPEDFPGLAEHYPRLLE